VGCDTKTDESPFVVEDAFAAAVVDVGRGRDLGAGGPRRAVHSRRGRQSLPE
jgi:hypothetical protein